MDKNMDAMKETAVSAFRKIHADFKAIMKHERCRTCSCLYADVISSVHGRIERFKEQEPDQRLTEIQKDFESWLKEAGSLMLHG